MKVTDAHRQANKRYDAKATQQIKLKLNLKTDADILERLSEVDNMQGYIKSLIRADIKEDRGMTKEELKRKAKVVLENGGVKVFQKDMDEVIVHKLEVRDYFPHREILYVQMKDGTTYEALQETVDQEGNFSLGSAKYITREIRKGHL